jgi:hypothetical protein
MGPLLDSDFQRAPTVKESPGHGKALLVFALALSVFLASAGEAASQKFQEVRIRSVVRDPRSAQPVVLLSDLKGERGLFIWIGEAEALALEAAIHRVHHRRPMTHDLLAGILEKLEARLIEVRITELREEVFYARLALESPKERLEIDARPSDAMVLAVRAGCPILVEETLFTTRSLSLSLPPDRRYGLELQELTEDLKAALGFHGDGVLVAEVESGGPADKAGLRREDILTQVGERPLSGVEDLERALAEPRGALEVKVFRKGKSLSVTLPLPGDP